MKVLGAWFLPLVLLGCHVDGHYFAPDAPPSNLLTVRVVGTGEGAVSSVPAGLECSENVCTGQFVDGAVVQLHASPTTGSFLGWDESCRGLGECTIMMDRAQVVGARFGTPGEALWVQQLGGVDVDNGEAIALDSNGDLIVAGTFRQAITAGVALTSQGSSDGYVVKLAGSTGTVIWARRFGGLGADRISGVAVDSSGNVYVSGTFESVVDFGGGTVSATGGIAAFVLKLDANGGFGWVRKVDGSDFSDRRIVIATNGTSVVMAGSYFGSIAIDATALTSTATSTDMFVLSVAASTGATTWIKSLGGTSYDLPRGIALDGSGDVILTGKFSGTVNFGGGPLVAPDSVIANGFLLRLAGATGAHLLSKRFGSARGATGAGVVSDPGGNILVTGDFLEAIDLGCAVSLSASQSGIQDVFLAKYTPAGACTWTKRFTGAASASPGRIASAVAVSGVGEIVIAGAFCGSISFGGGALSSASNCSPLPVDKGLDMFAARFSGDGALLGAVRAGGPSDDSGRGIAQSADGHLFVTGDFKSFAEFGGSARTAIGSIDTFIAGFSTP